MHETNPKLPEIHSVALTELIGCNIFKNPGVIMVYSLQVTPNHCNEFVVVKLAGFKRENCTKGICLDENLRLISVN